MENTDAALRNECSDFWDSWVFACYFFNILSLVWYSVSLNYYKNQLFFPKTFVCHIEAKREIKKYLNPFCLSTLVKQFYSALQAFSALEEANAAKPHL